MCQEQQNLRFHVELTKPIPTGVPVVQSSFIIKLRTRPRPLLRMLTHARRPLTSVRAFIIAPIPVSVIPCSYLLPCHPKMCRHALATTQLRTYSSHSEKSAPYALIAAARAFEEQVQCEDLHFLAETYGHLRQIVLEAQRRGLTSTDDPIVRENMLKSAMTLLVASPRQEHAALHLTIFEDLFPVFRVHSEIVPPLALTAEIFHEQLQSGAVDALPHIYEHLRNLYEASPAQVYPAELAASHIMRWMKLLCKYQKRETVDLMQNILHDLPRLFQVRPTLLHHELIIKAYLLMDMPDEAWSWLRRMELQAAPPSSQSDDPPSFVGKLLHMSGLGAHPKPPIPVSSGSFQSPIWIKPLSPQYDPLLKYFSQRGDVVSARMLITHMSATSTGVLPSQRSWHFLLAAVLNAQPPTSHQRARVQAVVEELEHAGHTVHLKLLGGIMDKGPIATLVEAEVFDVLRGAQARGNHQARKGQLGTSKRHAGGDVLHEPPSGDTGRVAASETLSHTTLPKTASKAPSNTPKHRHEVPSPLQVVPGDIQSPPVPPSHETSDTTPRTLSEARANLHETSNDAAPSLPVTAQVSEEQPPSHFLRPPITSGEMPQIASKPVEVGHLRVHPESSPTHREPPGDSEPSNLASFECIDGGSFGLHAHALSERDNHIRPVDTPQSEKILEEDSSRKPGQPDVQPSSREPLAAVSENSLVAQHTSLEQELVQLKDVEQGGSNVLPDASTNIPLSMRLQVQRSTLSSLQESTATGLGTAGPDCPAGSLDLTHVAGSEFDIMSSVRPIKPVRGTASSSEGSSTAPSGDSLHETSRLYLDKAETSALAQGTSGESRSRIGESATASDAVSVVAPPRAPRDAKTDPGNTTFRKLNHLIHNAIHRGDLRDASKHYADLIRVARPNLDIALSLLRALCRGSLRAPPRPHVLQALRIFKDLVEAEKQDVAEVQGFFDGTQPKEQRVDPRIYHILLRALSAPASTLTSPRDFGLEVQQEYTNLAMNLLADMAARGFRPDNRTATSVLLLRFRNAKDHQEAFECYRSMLAELESPSHPTSSHGLPTHHRSTTDTSPILDLKAFRAVLNAFGKLAFSGAPVAPAHLWFTITDDMRARGHLPTVEDYTIYLGGILEQKAAPIALRQASLGISSPAGEEGHMRVLYRTVKQVHERLALDPHISPDPHLLNTLMNAYQHLGAFNDAVRVFNTIWLSGRMDKVTPIIIFDACGHAGRQDIATMVWCMLVAKGWEFDKRTLDTWVECLCRLGNVEAACKFVCVYMGREKQGYIGKGDTRPNMQTCLILLKLSWVNGQNIEVKKRIQAHLPHIWNRLAPHYR